MNNAVRHHYRRFREHQFKLMVEDRYGLTTYPDGRTERTYSAPYGEHAANALASAKRHVFFLDRLRKEVRK